MYKGHIVGDIVKYLFSEKSINILYYLVQKCKINDSRIPTKYVSSFHLNCELTNIRVTSYPVFCTLYIKWVK